MNSFNMWLTMLIPYLVVLLALATVPFVSLRTPFGVSVPSKERQHAEISRMRRQHTLLLLIIAVVIAGLVGFLDVNGVGRIATSAAASADEASAPLLGSAATLGLLLVGFALFIAFHRRMLSLKEREGWQQEQPRQAATMLSFRNEPNTYGILWFIPSLLVTIICAVIAIMSYDTMPAIIPTKFDWDGTVIASHAKSWGIVLQLNFIQLAMIAGLAFTNMAISSSSVRLDPSRPEQSAEAERKYRRGISLIMVILCFFIVLLLGWVQAVALYQGSMGGESLFIAVIPMVLVGVSIFYMMRVNKGREAFDIPSRGEDRHWKLGSVYWNPDDPALMVEKRVGIGWTINAAKPLAWVILIVPILLVVGITSFADQGIFVRKTSGLGWTLDFSHPGAWFVLFIPIAVILSVLAWVNHRRH
ncbi:conserved hypothetical protein [Paenibacillus curdlanolyticus YK9]|uniref:DUF5808 domain-containing protein n=1 Tax=Paenibacillus curdlanolyticus YK9 TaxID=717606 RepID=E0I8U4_9BACL|nr:DUF5808 domain-containing protein [Paenibacillus curdlanolyticus]EFM10828.1 conserved hypothetical protein [Paenibacillus curdlanolyticus YK9]